MYRVFGIIGDPVSHSLSPAMHNAAFRALGIRAVYGAFWVKRDDLAKALSGLKALNISGVSVTIPHKEEIMSYLDEVDNVAKAIGAVNTVINKGGRLWGTNTDWLGVKKAFEERGINLEGKRAVVLGAGGASRAVIYALKEANIREVIIFNRTWERALELAKSFSVEALPWEELPKTKGDIIIQATSVGLKSKESPVSEEIIKNFQVAMDIVYLPLKTRFLELAERNHLVVIDGLRMLLHQGAEQFKLFTGFEPPLEVMERVLYEEVKKLEKEFVLGN